jgi:translation initiation factor 1A
MVNVKGGKNYKKGKKGKGKTSGKRTETPHADSPGLIYASVKRKLGGDRIEVECNDSQIRQAIIPGSFYKRVWVNPGDVLLVQINEMKTSDCFILYKYDINEIHYMKTQGSLKFEVNTADGIDDIVFGEQGSDEEDEDEIHRQVMKETKKEISKEDEKEKFKLKAKETELDRSNLRAKKQAINDEIDIDNI